MSMFVHGFGFLVDGPVLSLCLSTEMAFWWTDRCLSLVCPRNRPFGGWPGVCAYVCPRKWRFGGWTGVEPVFVHGNGLLVDGPVFVPMFIHGNGHLVDG